MPFTRRSYTVREEPPAPVRAEVIVRINGKIHTHVEMRSPGMLAVISREGEPETFHIEMLEHATAKRFVDRMVPDNEMQPTAWQLDAMKK